VSARAYVEGSIPAFVWCNLRKKTWRNLSHDGRPLGVDPTWYANALLLN